MDLAQLTSDLEALRARAVEATVEAAAGRVPVIANVADCSTRLAIRHGHMYAYRLCQALGLDPEDGVVRASMVHYNTLDEIERFIEVLERIL
jgi:selenocysteine lyase/cysteine desulfurase